MTKPTWILPLDAPHATLAIAGGKGMNLAKMAQAGLPVPGGFLLTTDAYQSYVTANGLAEKIAGILNGPAVQLDDPDSLQTISTRIRALFAQGEMPAALRKEIMAAHAPFAAVPLAVRSSATAEDLPEMSFAGQQDSFLNVVGVDPFLQAVVECWSSLWTARAIGYRTRNGIDHQEVALAVVAQQMVQSEASGVLFTANPLTGKRDETVIDATLGLGEALVAGLVSPDHYVVDSANNHILSKELGEKGTVIRSVAQGGTETITGGNPSQAISDEAILALAEMGQKTASIFGAPQDIEWGWANGKIYILQSRPVTSLFPVPAGVEQTGGLRVMFSFGAVQGMLDPMTPFGQDAIRGVLGNGTTAFNVEYAIEKQKFALTAGERLWLDLTPFMRHKQGRKLIQNGLSMIEPATQQAWESLLEDERLQPNHGFKLRHLRRVFPILPRILRQILRAMRRPDAVREKVNQEIDGIVADYDQRFQATTNLAERVALFETALTDLFPIAIPRLFPLAVAGLMSWRILHRLADRIPNAPNTLLLSRALPHNVTTEMDLALWETAQKIRADSRPLTSDSPPLLHFLGQYGMRGLGEIDIGRPRWRENPEALLQTLHSYLAITDPALAPPAIFAQGERAATETIEQLVTAARQTRGGWLKAKLIRALAYRTRALAGLRESPKFYIIRMFGLARHALLESGQKLAADGTLNAPDDLFFLQIPEARALGRGEERDWQSVIAERRVNHAREQKRRQIPRLLLSDGRAFYEGVTSLAEDGEGVLRGSGVSPGVVEGQVRVVRNPFEANLQPGEILVCRATDPAWTPLFLAAGGLVMEVGGMMTHGSVVAREYGIPAVVGAQGAMEQLESGQLVRVDGNAGIVELLS